jgi:hypothetical protein
MRTSIVVLTHERPAALALVLRGLAAQTVPPAEVVVTEDGSGPATRALVERLRPGLPFELAHVSQAYRGPRMARARNRGVAASSGEHVVFLDGDMIPTRTFVADHRAALRPGVLVQGSRALASPERTEALLALPADAPLNLAWFARGLSRRHVLFHLPAVAELWARPHRRRAGAKSCNLGFWRHDLVRLNGFNEAMEGWGLEDAEIVQRAFHLGLWRRDVRLAAGAVHLWHPPHTLAADNPNWPVLRAVERAGTIRCERGLDQHLHPIATA